MKGKQERKKEENETDNLFGINRPGLKNWKKIILVVGLHLKNYKLK